MNIVLPLFIFGLCGSAIAQNENPLIDYKAQRKMMEQLEQKHEESRVSEDEFIRLSREPGTLILDARTKERYDAIHVKGAVSLPLTEFTADSLAKVIPDKSTLVLIYCNNNFSNEPVNFASKFAPVSLNIHTFINLHAYGYTNVRELRPLLDVKTTKLLFEGGRINAQGHLIEKLD